MKSITFLLFFILIKNSCFAQEIILETDSLITAKYVSSISSTGLKKHIDYLASDELMGRDIESKGLELAANYLSSYFEESGFGGSKFDYAQPFDLYDTHCKDCFISFKNGVIKGEDIHALFQKSFQDSIEFVFAGKGEERDYSGIDVKNRAVVVFANPETNPQVLAGKKGAKLVFLAYKNHDAFEATASEIKKILGRKKLSYPKQKEFSHGLYSIDQNTLNLIFGENLPLLQQYEVVGKLNKKSKNALKTKLYVNLDYQVRKTTVRNVLGMIEGTDLKNEVIVVSAHYDHIGKSKDGIFNGANDNASGVAAVLGISKAFMDAKKAGSSPRRTIVFMAFAAEEIGIFGSKYYVDHPIYSLENTIANLNFDMVGRVNKDHLDNPNYVCVVGSDRISTDLHWINEASQKKYVPNLQLDYEYSSKDHPKRLYYRSDQVHFAKKGIPIIFYTDVTLEDYHQPSDTADKINYGQLLIRTRLGFATAWELANRDERPR